MLVYLRATQKFMIADFASTRHMIGGATSYRLAARNLTRTCDIGRMRLTNTIRSLRA